MSIQQVRTISYHSNSSILSREDLLFLEASKKAKQNNLHLHHHCSCPQILACDDEQYQHCVVQKLIDLEAGHGHERSSLNCKFFGSGEELIKNYLELRSLCSCGGPRIVISDYNMGIGFLDGVSFILKMREIGFCGIAILRTSESMQSLEHDHDEIYEHFESKRISLYVCKNDMRKQKELFRELNNKNL